MGLFDYSRPAGVPGGVAVNPDPYAEGKRLRQGTLESDLEYYRANAAKLPPGHPGRALFEQRATELETALQRAQPPAPPPVPDRSNLGPVSIQSSPLIDPKNPMGLPDQGRGVPYAETPRNMWETGAAVPATAPAPEPVDPNAAYRPTFSEEKISSIRAVRTPDGKLVFTNRDDLAGQAQSEVQVDGQKFSMNQPAYAERTLLGSDATADQIAAMTESDRARWDEKMGIAQRVANQNLTNDLTAAQAALSKFQMSEASLPFEEQLKRQVAKDKAMYDEAARQIDSDPNVQAVMNGRIQLLEQDIAKDRNIMSNPILRTQAVIEARKKVREQMISERVAAWQQAMNSIASQLARAGMLNYGQ